MDLSYRLQQVVFLIVSWWHTVAGFTSHSCVGHTASALYPCSSSMVMAQYTNQQINIRTGHHLPAPFFDETGAVRLTTDGLVVFDDASTILPPVDNNFTLIEQMSCSHALIVLWNKYDYSSGSPGVIGYSTDTADPELLALASNDLTTFRHKHIEVDYVFVATWYNIPFTDHDDSNPGLHQTASSFQAAFVTTTEDVDHNGVPDMYAVMSYDGLELTFQNELEYDDFEDDSDYSWAGILKSHQYFELNPLSGGSLMNYTSKTSNIGVPGRWVVPLFEDISGLKNYRRTTWYGYTTGYLFNKGDGSGSENYRIYLEDRFNFVDYMCWEIYISEHGVVTCDDYNTGGVNEDYDGFAYDVEDGGMFAFYGNFDWDSDYFPEIWYTEVLKRDASSTQLNEMIDAQESIYILTGEHLTVDYMIHFTWINMEDDDEDGRLFDYQMSIARVEDTRVFQFINYRRVTGAYAGEGAIYSGYMTVHDDGGTVFTLPRCGSEGWGYTIAGSNVGITGRWVIPLYHTTNGASLHPFGYSECRFVQCENGGTCSQSLIDGDYYCRCLPGYSGKFCHQEDYSLDTCYGVACLHGGTCTGSLFTHACQCVSGYEGQHCETEIVDPCYDVTCYHDGTCVLSGGHTSTCICAIGFEGAHCELETVDPCAHVTCQNNGTCLLNGLHHYKCMCLSGFDGKYCQNDIDECDLKSHGCDICRNTFGSYDCFCPPGQQLSENGRTCSLESLKLSMVLVTTRELWNPELADKQSIVYTTVVTDLKRTLLDEVHSTDNYIYYYDVTFSPGSLILHLDLNFDQELSLSEKTVIATEIHDQALSGEVLLNGQRIAFNTARLSTRTNSVEDSEIPLTDICVLYKLASYCKQGSHCIDVDHHPVCSCKSGWTGVQCDEKEDDGIGNNRTLVYVLFGLVGLLLLMIIFTCLLIIKAYSRIHDLYIYNRWHEKPCYLPPTLINAPRYLKCRPMYPRIED